MVGGARKRLNRVYSLHLKTSSLARSSPRLSEAMLGAASAITAAQAILDEAALAKLVRETSEEEWMKVLNSVADALRKTGVANNDTVGEFRFFLDNALKACVDANLPKQLEITLRWFEDVNNTQSIVDKVNFFINHEAMLRACKKKDFELVSILFSRGFKVTSELADPHLLEDPLGHDHMDVVVQLSRLEALSSPAYILAEAINDPTSCHADPVKKALVILEAVGENESRFKTFSYRFDQVRRDLEEFIVVLLDYCSDQDEVELFLGQSDPGICGEKAENASPTGTTTLLPRINEALHLKLVEVVTHDSVQMVIRKTFYDEGYDNLRFRSTTSKVGRALLHILLLPIGAVIHVVNRRLLCCMGKDNKNVTDEEEGFKLRSKDDNNDEEERDNNNETNRFNYRNVMRLFEVPANRLTSQIVCYFVFLLLLAMSQINPNDKKGKIDMDFYDILVIVWTLGNIARDLGLMHSRAEEAAARSTWCSLTPWRKFFSKKLYTFRLTSHLTLLLGLTIETLGYLCESKIPMRDPHNRDCDIDDPYSYGGFHLVKVGISLQGLALTMVVLYGLHLFRLDSDMGAFYIALGRCLKIVASFFTTLAVVSLGFAMGMHAMLRFSGEECRDGHAVLSDCGGGSQFYMERVEIGLACEIVLEEGADSKRSNRTLCKDECWKAYVMDPTNEERWSEACTSSGMQMVPKIETDLYYLGVGDDFVSLVAEKNRFRTLRSTLKTVFWSLFSAGHPQVVGCTEGAVRQAALALWAIYALVSVTILINLLIALMGVTMSSLQESKISNWKFYRTQLWMEYCEIGVVLPPPFNLLDLLAGIVTCRWSSCSCCGRKQSKVYPDNKDDQRNCSTQRKSAYLELIRHLSSVYLCQRSNNDKNA